MHRYNSQQIIQTGKHIHPQGIVMEEKEEEEIKKEDEPTTLGDVPVSGST